MYVVITILSMLDVYSVITILSMLDVYVTIAGSIPLLVDCYALTVASD
jgi:hypothetical protein